MPIPYRLPTAVLLVAGVIIGGAVFADKPDAGEDIPYEEIRRLTDALGQIKENYVEEVDDKTLLNSALKGMLEGLDPHSSYLEAEDFESLQESTSGEFGGLGIEVTMENGFVKVVSPIDDTPAQRKGIQPGDLIIRLDGEPVKGMSLNEAVNVMRGEPGTRIELTIVREDEDAPFKLTIERDVIQVKSVRGEMLEPGYGYVRISTFQTRTGQDLLEVLDELKEKGELKGLVLDLRNNPGGVLAAAREVADAFLDSGLIVYTEGRNAESKVKYNARPGDAINGAPMAVLVNGGSASAAEIVAGAIQDQLRGLVMGETTFGKASVQTIVQLDNGAAIKLTTARYYTPKGRSIQAEGIEPDIPLKRARLELLEDKERIGRVKESNLSGHLQKRDRDDDGEQEEQDKAPDSDEEAEEEEKLQDRDYEVSEALNLLKGLNIYRDREGGAAAADGDR